MIMWYVGLDVHGETTSISVRSSRGAVVRREVVATTRAALRHALRGVRGRVQIACEAGPMARWTRDMLETRLREVLVCDRRRTRLGTSKADRVDADRLSDLLAKNELHPIFVPRGEQAVLRRLCVHYIRMIKDRTRVIIRLRALFLESGTHIRTHRSAPEKVPLGALRDHGEKYVVRAYLLQLNTATELVHAARKEMIDYAGSFAAFELLQSIPHVGEIRAAQLLAIVVDPARFRSLRRFWSFGGLGVIQKASSEHRIENGMVIRDDRVRGVHLAKACQPILKKVLRDIALYASIGRGAFRTIYDGYVARGMRPALARVALARKVAAVILAVWRSGNSFNETLLLRHTNSG